MSHHDDHDDRKGAKKKAVLTRNRKHQNIYRMVKEAMREQERIKQEAGKLKPKSVETSAPEPTWDEKVAVIRNRLTGKKRISRERWNRFSGTSDSGGRGL